MVIFLLSPPDFTKRQVYILKRFIISMIIFILPYLHPIIISHYDPL